MMGEFMMLLNGGEDVILLFEVDRKKTGKMYSLIAGGHD